MRARDPLDARPTGNGRGRFHQTRHSPLVAVLVASLAVGGLVAFAGSRDSKSVATAQTAGSIVTADAAASDSVASVVAPDPSPSVEDATTTTVVAAGAAATADAAALVAGTDLDEATVTTGDGCQMTEESVRLGSSGDSVACLQNALLAAGLYAGAMTGTFDAATDAAVRKLQTERDLFVDGVAGRESGISLDIWPAEGSDVVHTPAQAEGTVDPMGFPLSTVSSTGADAPPLPADSGTGKRLVYSRAGQRVWAVSSDGTVIRSWLVSGSKYSNEEPGVHVVYSKSEKSTAWNGKAILPHMVRYQKTNIGNIGFHGIPTHVSDGTAYQTEAELGQRLSGGCQRQANRDADFVWAFADIGTTVVVI